MSAELSTYEIKAFMTMVEGVRVGEHQEVMVTAVSKDEKAIMIARGGKNDLWKISIVEKKEVPEWPGPE